MLKFKSTFLIVPLTLAVFFLTKNPLTRPFSLQMLLVSLLTLIIVGFILRKKDILFSSSKRFLYLFMTTILLLVGATGWFFSPFFFTLYLLAILLAFVFSPLVSILFVATLVTLFSFNIGEVDLAYDFLVILSLLTTIPLSLYLRKEYLRLQESAKEILILQKQKEHFESKVDEVLANIVSKLAVSLRQPINDIKQLTYRMEEVKGEKELKKHRERILTSSEEALRILRTFEEETTGKKPLHNPELINAVPKAREPYREAVRD